MKRPVRLPVRCFWLDRSPDIPQGAERESRMCAAKDSHLLAECFRYNAHVTGGSQIRSVGWHGRTDEIPPRLRYRLFSPPTWLGLAGWEGWHHKSAGGSQDFLKRNDDGYRSPADPPHRTQRGMHQQHNSCFNAKSRETRLKRIHRRWHFCFLDGLTFRCHGVRNT